MTITVFLVDDHEMVRTGVRLGLTDEFLVVGEASTVEDSIAGIAATNPDVVLLDVHLPDGGGLGILGAPHDPHSRFLALSVSDAAEDVIEVIRAGASGYVTKSITASELCDAIRRIADGDVVFGPRLAGFVLDAFRSVAEPTVSQAAELDALTPRELEVLRLIARGYTYREVATELFISTKTVETHTSSVFRKLQVSNRHQLTTWATNHRIV